MLQKKSFWETVVDFLDAASSLGSQLVHSHSDFIYLLHRAYNSYYYDVQYWILCPWHEYIFGNNKLHMRQSKQMPNEESETKN